MGKQWEDEIKLSAGYTQIPNLLLNPEYFDKLNIDDKELLFIIRISRFSEGFIITDDKISSNSRSSMYRTRKSLVEKGYIITTSHKKKMPDGNWISTGTSYDLTPLQEELYDILPLTKTGEPNARTGEPNAKTGEPLTKTGEPNARNETSLYKSSSVKALCNSSSTAEDTTTSNVLGNNIEQLQEGKGTTLPLSRASPSLPPSQEIIKVLDAYHLHVDDQYVLQPKDIMTMNNFDYTDKLAQYMTYWTIWSEGDKYKGIYPYKTLDDFDKKHTAKLHVITKHWNDFSKYCKKQIENEELIGRLKKQKEHYEEIDILWDKHREEALSPWIVEIFELVSKDLHTNIIASLEYHDSIRFWIWENDAIKPKPGSWQSKYLKEALLIDIDKGLDGVYQPSEDLLDTIYRLKEYYLNIKENE